jgi:hypothetical protein
MTTSPQIFSKLIMGLRPHDTPCVPRAKLTIPTFMKIRHKRRNASSRSADKNLTLGNLIIASYGAYGEQRAPKIVQLAIDSHLVRFEKAVNIKFARFLRR